MAVNTDCRLDVYENILNAQTNTTHLMPIEQEVKE